MFKYLLFSLFLVTACTSDTKAIQTDDPYYLKLEKQCHERNSPNCCLASLQGMVDTRSKLADTNSTCPTGYQRMMMKCRDTYVWCEKIEK